MSEETKSLRHNSGKPKWSMVHFKSIEELPRVLEFGSIKYDRGNWMLGLDLNEIKDSMQRHLAELIDGNELDEESGLHHIGHIMCNCMFYMYHKNKQDEKQLDNQ